MISIYWLTLRFKLSKIKSLAFLNLELEILADLKVLAFQNPEFKILVDLKILAFQNPKFKIYSTIQYNTITLF